VRLIKGSKDAVALQCGCEFCTLADVPYSGRSVSLRSSRMDTRIQSNVSKENIAAIQSVHSSRLRFKCHVECQRGFISKKCKDRFARRGWSLRKSMTLVTIPKKRLVRLSQIVRIRPVRTNERVEFAHASPSPEGEPLPSRRDSRALTVYLTRSNLIKNLIKPDF